MTIAVVTGASSGIGEATARLLVQEHAAELVLVARREDRLRALAQELGASYCACDLTEDDAPGRCAPTSRSATTASTCSSTTPARRGGRRSPTAAGRTCSGTWRSTSTPSSG